MVLIKMESIADLQISQARFSSFGTSFMGSTLSFFSKNLATSTSKNTPLFFLAREGYWLEKAYQQYLSGSDKQGNSCYLLASRAFLFKLLLSDSRSYEYSLKGDFNGSFFDLMRTRFLLSNAEIQQVFSKDITQELVYLPHDRKKIIAVLNQHQELLDNVISYIKKPYLAYLASLGVTAQSTLHLVDLGYSGTIQSLLTILLNKDTVGHYLISSKPGEHRIADNTATMKGYLKEGVKLGEGYLPLDRSMFLESLLTAPFGQFRGIRFNTFDKNTFDFYYGRKVSSQRYFYELEQVMAGALEYCHHTGKHQIEFNSDELELLLNNYLSKPNMIPRSTKHIFDIDDDVTGNGTVNALQFFGLA